MLRNSTLTLSRPSPFPNIRNVRSLYTLKANSLYPFLNKQNNSLYFSQQAVRGEEYQGRVAPDSDHQLPVQTSKSTVNSQHHEWTSWDKFLNPQLITSADDLKPNEQYMGPRTGVYFANIGWKRVGSGWTYKNRYRQKVQKWWKNRWAWQEKPTSPRWKAVPRIGDFNPQQRYVGKLQYSEVKLSQIIWAIDIGKLNRNEVITLWHLKECGVVPEEEIIWPGAKLVDDGVTPRYPISLELQNGSPEAIQKIEDAGGSFVSAYLSLDGLYQTLHPEEYPTFIDQHLPDRMGMTQVAMSDQARGYLCRFYENEAKYAHPEAGRRLSHYIRPPTDRDFPATFEEYERVRHHQKWHLNQSGTGTILPFISSYSAEDAPNPPTALAGAK